MELRVDTNDGFVIRNKIVNVSGDFVDIASWGITAFVPGGGWYYATGKGNREGTAITIRL